MTQKRKTSEYLSTSAILLSMGAISCLPIYFGGLYLHKGYQSENWTATTAIVEQARTIKTPSGDSKTRNTYKFKYRYWVEGKTYLSKRNSYKAGGGDVAWIVDRVQKGDSIQVFYNPLNPSEVVVEKGYSLLQVVWILAGMFGLGMCGFGCAGLRVQMIRGEDVPDLSEKQL